MRSDARKRLAPLVDAPDDVEALARALLAATYRTGNPPPFEAVDSVYRHRAELLLASDWLAARDADLTARAEAAALMAAADPMEIVKWTEGTRDGSLSVAAVTRYLSDRARAAASYTRDGADGEADHGLCNFRGPRIGEDMPRCRRPINHTGVHQNVIEDGFGQVISW